MNLSKMIIIYAKIFYKNLYIYTYIYIYIDIYIYIYAYKNGWIKTADNTQLNYTRYYKKKKNYDQEDQSLQ